MFPDKLRTIDFETLVGKPPVVVEAKSSVYFIVIVPFEKLIIAKLPASVPDCSTLKYKPLKYSLKTSFVANLPEGALIILFLKKVEFNFKRIAGAE